MRVLIIGGATRVTRDVAAARELCEFDAVMVINDMATRVESVDHWVTLHPEKISQWRTERRQRGHETDVQCWAPTRDGVPAHVRLETHPDWDPSGLSGLYATRIALERLGATRVVLAGIPMDKSGHALGKRGHWISLGRRHSWVPHLPTLRQSVRSVSGWTREVLGAPTMEWLS